MGYSIEAWHKIYFMALPSTSRLAFKFRLDSLARYLNKTGW